MTEPHPSYDVIVVGGGGAGLMATLRAARAGAKTLLLEKNPSLGGTTRLSVGSISANGTPQQAAAGIADNPDDHFEDLGKFAGPLEPRDNLDLRRVYVDNIAAAMRDLMDVGLVFADPVPEPPHRVPRLHNVLPHSGAFIRALSAAANAAGATIRTGAAVADLTTAGGRVTGVVLSDGERLLARRGVVLTSGDYSGAGPDLKADFLPEAIRHVEGINVTATGDGQRMGRAIGSDVVNPDLVWGPEMRFLAPPKPSAVTRIPPTRAFATLTRFAMRALPGPLLRPFLMSFVTTFLAPSKTLLKEGALLINIHGERFCDETDAPEIPVSRQPDRRAFILLDGAMTQKFEAWPYFVSTAPGVGYAYLSDYRRNRRDIFHSAGSLPQLAQKAGLPGDALTATVARYNADASARGGRPAFGDGPYTLLGPLKSWLCFTEGGLRTDTSLRVLRADGTAIAGLFAAGSAGQGGLILEGHGHHLGWAFVSGRIAGAAAACCDDSAPATVSEKELACTH